MRVSFGRQCPPIPSLGSRIFTFHLVLRASRSSEKFMLFAWQYRYRSSANAICRYLCAFSIVFVISATSIFDTGCIGMPRLVLVTGLLLLLLVFILLLPACVSMPSLSAPAITQVLLLLLLTPLLLFPPL